MGVKQTSNKLTKSIHNFYEKNITSKKRKTNLAALGTILLVVLLGLFVTIGVQLARF